MLLFKNPVERIKQSVWLILVAVVMQGIISSCHRDDEILPQTNLQVPAQLTTTKLGKKLKNPYSVENMQKALDMMLKETREVQSQRAEAFGQTAQHQNRKNRPLRTLFAQRLCRTGIDTRRYPATTL